MIEYEPIAFERAADFFSKPLPKLDWTVANLIEQSTFVVLGGEPKTSKTWAALEIALSVASGAPCFNQAEFHCNRKPKPVFLFLLEDGKHNVHARMMALAKAKHLTKEHLKAMPLYIRCRKPIDLDLDADDIIAAIKAEMMPMPTYDNTMEPGLILIDPLRNAHTREENDSGEMRKVMDACLRIRDETGFSLVVNHHFKKMKKGDEDSPGNAMRGSSSIYGAVDGIIGMRRIECDNKNTWRNNVHCQVKAGPQAAPFGLELKVEDGKSGRANWAGWDVGGTYL